MRIRTAFLCSLFLCHETLLGDQELLKKPTKEEFNPYVPEVYLSYDKTLPVKWYTFSKRQLDFMTSREFDQQTFAEFLRKKWPIEQLQTYARKTRQSRLPNKIGYGAAKFIPVEVYAGEKHRFDSIKVTVYDRLGYSIGDDQGHHTNEEGSQDEIKRWAWLITMKKGKKSWSIQAELPNHRFDKKIEESKSERR